MRIAILGAGNVGGGLAAAAVRAGHDVVISASTPENARSSAQATGATAAASNLDAVRGADVVVLAVPYGAAADIVGELGDTLSGTVVVDATNPVNDTYTDLVHQAMRAGVMQDGRRTIQGEIEDQLSEKILFVVVESTQIVIVDVEGIGPKRRGPLCRPTSLTKEAGQTLRAMWASRQ